MSTSVPELPWYHVGPHGFYDLIRLARRGRTVLVRIFYVLALFAALAVVYYNADGALGPPPKFGKKVRRPAQRELFIESINHNARIAERFCITILLMQNIAVLLLTPIYMAASIQEERDKRTFPLLFTTQLTARSIVLGKWLSRCAHVGVVLLAGLPVLSLVQLWGGIDMAMIAANFLNTAMLLACVGALSLLIAARSRSLLRAVGETYLLLAILFMCCAAPQGIYNGVSVLFLAPFGDAPHNYGNMWYAACFFGSIYTGLSIAFIQRATILCAALKNEEKPPVEELDWSGVNVPRNRFRRWPEFSENVIAWKERYLEQDFTVNIPYVLLAFVATLALGYATAWALHFPGAGGDADDLVAFVFKFLALECFFIYFLLVIWRVTGTIVRERQQRTLESIVTLPWERREILTQKIVGNLQRQMEWAWPASLAALVAILLGQGHPWVALLLAIVLAVHLAFFVALAAFLSVHCRTVVSAYVSLGVVLLVIFVATSIVCTFFDLPSIQRGVNPVCCWYTIAEDWWRLGQPTAWAAIARATLIYAVAAAALWRTAAGRFEREPV